MVISYYDQTETEMVAGLLATSKVIAHNCQSRISENIENIVLDISLPKSKSITVGIIYKPLSQLHFIDHFHNALSKLPFHSIEIICLCFKKLKEAQLKHWLLKPYVKTFLAFGLNQLTEKPTRFTLRTVSLIDHFSTNSKENVSHNGVIFNGISDHDFIY